MLVEVQIVNTGKHPIPNYATAFSAGVDLYANIGDLICLKSLERVLVPTGLHIALPIGFEAQVRPRSGNALKMGLTVLNSPGTIDSDYRGEVKVILVNLSHEDIIINDGDRIAQMVISKFENVTFVAVASLDETLRGAGGFGHTGIK